MSYFGERDLNISKMKNYVDNFYLFLNKTFSRDAVCIKYS